MPKHLYCAQCGEELLQFRKAVKGEIFDFVQPHTCAEVKEPTLENEPIPVKKEKPGTAELSKMFDEFQFVQKLNGLDKSTGDKREPEVLRKEKNIEPTSSAPLAVQQMIKDK